MNTLTEIRDLTYQNKFSEAFSTLNNSNFKEIGRFYLKKHAFSVKPPPYKTHWLNIVPLKYYTLGFSFRVNRGNGRFYNRGDGYGYGFFLYDFPMHPRGDGHWCDYTESRNVGDLRACPWRNKTPLTSI